jgi:hypothetical protein
MPALRLRTRLIMLFLSLFAVGCGSGAPREEAADPARLLTGGRRDAAQWIAEGRTAGELSPAVVIPLGYIERLRLGLGSPFRLIDYALSDPRLEGEVRLRTAHAILARTLDRQSYQVDPTVLDLVGLAGSEWVAGVGRYHLRLIDDAISEALDPRVGELAVRLAYLVAAAEGSVDPEAPKLIAQAAALIRDRELARNDARRLVRAAQEAGTDPVRLVAGWRSERRFEVEQPALLPVGADAEREAIEYSLRLARSVHALGPRLGGGSGISQTSRSGTVSLLGPGAAHGLAAAATALGMPPRTPVAVAVDAQHPELRVPWLTGTERAAWRRFLERARDEEQLVAEYAILVDGVPDALTAAGEAVLGAAVGMRTYAQERVWFPGFGGPSARELEDRFGLAAIRFDDDVPSAWRPYYRGVLAESLGELQRVLPSLNVRGLSFHFGASRGGAATLALHDPLRRTIYLSPETGMGTLAHEVAHDLDWQAALRRYRVRGDYASDRAVRERGDRLAGSLQRLTTATLRPPIPGDPSPVIHAQRPAEVFARSVDWFVLVSLAREGRSNGYLSSAQDAMLTGYGTVRPPEIGGSAGQALVTILDDIAPIYPATRDWFLQSYGPNRALSPYDLVRRILETEPTDEMVGGDRMMLALKGAADQIDEEEPAPGPGITGIVMARLHSLGEARDAAFAAVDAWVCRAPAASAGDPRLGVARRQLIARATEARARGLTLHYAGLLAGERGRSWMARRFYGTPWPAAEVEPLMAALLESIAGEVRELGKARVETRPGISPWQALPDRCVVAALLPG